MSPVIRAVRAGTALMAVAFLTSCDRVDPRPAAPSPVPAPPVRGAPASVYGEIAITSITPEPGARVPVATCAPGSARFCAERPLVTLAVVVDRDIDNAVLTVMFDRCGFTSTAATSLAADRPVSLTTSVINLSDDGPLHDGAGAALFCPLPAATTSTTVILTRSGEPNRILLTREFSKGYTFANP